MRVDVLRQDAASSREWRNAMPGTQADSNYSSTIGSRSDRLGGREWRAVVPTPQEQSMDTDSSHSRSATGRARLRRQNRYQEEEIAVSLWRPKIDIPVM